MYEQDYIMRLIREIVRFIAKVVFGVDTESPTTEILEDNKNRQILNRLLRMVDDGQINEAENMLSDIITDPNQDDLALAILFYSHLNEKSDDFLEEHQFSRQEVIDGLKTVAAKYGLEGIADMFLE